MSSGDSADACVMSDAAPPGKKQAKPYIVRCDAGKYAYCRCQQSSRFPYCDGTHRYIDGGGADVGPIKTVFERAVTVAWCACGESQSKPFCDGSHAALADDDTPLRP